MGRRLERNDSVIEFQKYHSGCLSGILHNILAHHHRSNLKRILPRRKQGRGRHPKCCRNPKTHSLEHDTEDLQGYLNVDAVPLLVDEEKTGANVISQRSSKAHVKALVSKEMTGKLGLHQMKLSHYQRSSTKGRSGSKTSWTSPIIILQRTSDADSDGWHPQSQLPSPLQASISEKIDVSATSQPEGLRLNRQTSVSQFKESADILEIFQVNKKLFLEILHDPGVQGAKRVHVQQNSTPQFKLKRSGSFPAAEPSGMRSLRPNTPEHKKTETWSFSTAINLSSVVQSTKALASNDTRDEKTKVAAISPELNRNGRYSSVMSYITDLKKKIRHALKHNKKASQRSIMTEQVPEQSLERSGRGNDLDTDSRHIVRRTCSLNESMNKYTQLINNSSHREATPRVYRSRSLKLTSDDRNLSRGSSMKTFRRRLSLPDDIGSLFPFQDEDSSDDLKSQMPNGKAAESYTDIANQVVLNNSEAECFGIGPSRDQSDSSTCVVGETKNLSETSQDEHPASSVNAIDEDEDRSPVSVLDTHFRQNVGGSTESSKGQCPEPSNVIAGQLDRTTDPSSTRPIADPSAAEPDIEDDPYRTYVRDLLYVSGFLEEDSLATWHSLDQPLSPKLYKELEAFLHHDDDNDDDHRLVFDLVNDTLLDVFETQLAYFPMQLSIAQRNTRPVPKGSYVLEEVWKRMSWCRNSGASWKDRSLNDIVERDFSKGDEWMKLRFDVEDVALDLEDVIFDELLDELVFE